MRGSSRGRTQFTKAALSRAVDVAREKGINQLTLELPGGGRIILPLGQDKPSQKNEWDEALYGEDKAAVRK
jgi:hypothetical protein